jgi:hypothetical protein
MRLIQRIFFLLTLALMATAVQAQAVFRSVMPDGKVVYGDKPAPGAKESKQVNLAPLNISTPAPGSTPAPPDTLAPAGNNNSADVATAQQNLEAARRALEAGRELREGDRIGIASKGGATNSRLSDSYLNRVKQLEDAVAAAQSQLEEAQRAAGR